MADHNSYYHRYLLRQIPNQIHRALDVGCGLGSFAEKLAERAEIVDALDVDRAILAAASRDHAAANLAYFQANFLTADLPETAYGVIVAIASLHHMDLEAALSKMKLLLCPAGKLLILGLYREETPLDYAYSAVSVPLNFCRLWQQTSVAPAAPTCPAQLSLSQIKTVAYRVLPGCDLRRHLFWRYSLIWQKP